MFSLRGVSSVGSLVCFLALTAAAQYTSNQLGSPQYQNAHNHDAGNDMSQAIQQTFLQSHLQP